MGRADLDQRGLERPSRFVELARRLRNEPVWLGRSDWIELHEYDLHAGSWSHGGNTHLRISLTLGGAPNVTRRLEGCAQSGVRCRGSISITPAGAEGSWSWDGPQHAYLAFVPLSLVGEIAIENFDCDSSSVEFRAAHCDPDPLIAACLGSLGTEWSEPLSELRAEATAKLMAVHLLSRYSNLACSTARPYGLSTRQQRLALECIEERLLEPLALDEIARYCELSKYHFVRAFKRTFGKTPHAFILERRVLHAQQLMRDPHMRLTHVALSSGFSSSSQFSATFRRICGLSPSEWRHRRSGTAPVF